VAPTRARPLGRQRRHGEHRADRAPTRVLSAAGRAGHGGTRQAALRPDGERWGREVRTAQPLRPELPVARSAGRRRHGLAHDRCTGQDVLDCAAAHGDRGARRSDPFPRDHASRDMKDGRVLYDVADGVAALTLNRPEKRNALDAATVAALREAFARAGADPDARVVLLRGAGNDFCAGADLAHMERLAETGDPLENLADASALGDLFIEMRRLEKPIVAAVHGHAFAGGAGLATACDLVVASESAIFGYPEV